MSQPPRKALGKGLGALISSAEDRMPSLVPPQNTEHNHESLAGVLEIDINKVEPNKDQPRKRFDEDKLTELADSIKQFGIIQPIVVTRVDNAVGFFKIVAGERRWRAARIAELRTVPVIVKDLADMEVLQIALIENIQRQDLNPIEEALCYQQLCDVFFFRQEDIAGKVGKSRATVSGMMSLLKLDPRVQNFIAEGKLTAGHGRKLLEIESGNTQFEIGEKIIEDELSINQISSLIESLNKKAPVDDNDKTPQKEATTISEGNKILYKSIENELMSALGTKVAIKDKKDKGKIEIDYYSQDELDRLIGLFKKVNM